jgi:hypothetical protein
MAGDWRTTADLEDRAEDMIRRTYREGRGRIGPPDAGLVAMARTVVREAYQRGQEAAEALAEAEREEEARLEAEARC